MELSGFKTLKKPATIEELKELLSSNTGVDIIAGNTAKHVEKFYRPMASSSNLTKIDISHVTELGRVTNGESTISFGATVTLEEMKTAFAQLDSQIYRQAAEFLVKVGSVPMRNQATWAGSLTLQKNVANFASDVSVMLASLGMQLSVLDYSSSPISTSTMSVEEYLAKNSKKLLVTSGALPNVQSLEQSQAFATFAKVMPRPTMAAGIITVGFVSHPADSSGKYFASSADGGFRQLSGSSSFTKDEMNARLASEPNVLIRGQLLKHFSGVLGDSIGELEHSQIEYNVDDSEQPDRAKHIPQKHAHLLTEGTAEFPSDQKPACDQVYLKFVPATQLANVKSISFAKCSSIKGFIRGFSAKDIHSAGFQNTFIPTVYGTEADEFTIEEIVCSSSVLYINQPVAFVAAMSQFAADEAAKLVQVEYSEWAMEGKTKPMHLDEAIKAGDFFPSLDGFYDFDNKEAGNVDQAMAARGVKTLSGEVYMPGQYHNFMETHHASANIEDGQIEINVGSQALDKVQRAVAFCLGIPHAQVVAKCRRTGGGFGGKVRAQNSCFVQFEWPITTGKYVI